MCDIYVKDFMMMCKPDHIERHSDSSDFENSAKKLVITPKYGNHHLLHRKCSKETLYKCPKDFNNSLRNSGTKLRKKSYRPCPNSFNHVTSYVKNYKIEDKKINTGDNQRSTEKLNTRALVRDKVMPCLSTIFRRSNNNIKHVVNIEEDEMGIVNDCNKTHCLNCKRRHVNELCDQQGSYPVQTVYTGENIQTSPFNKRKNRLYSNPKTSNSSASYNISLSSEAEAENIKKNKYRKFLNSVKEKLEKELRKECAECYTMNTQQQQYPSKLQIKLPCQVYTSTSCLENCSTTKANGLSRVSSISSSFWDLFTQKMKSKIQDKCDCKKLPQPCSPQTCENLSPFREYSNSNYKYNQMKSDSCCRNLNTNSTSQQTETSSADSNTSTKKKNKEIKQVKAICKCYSKGKSKSSSKKIPLVEGQNDKYKPCQASHGDITSAISQKYKGEILCIHNPPCILINGCLNFPPPKTYVQQNLWPVSQSKKSSFVQMCRKMKRTKQKTDNANQYHPPYAELQQCLPEFKSEKIIQSICNHDPPCEIVHGCYKAKYDPKLQNSCVHVPMCRKLPECLLVDKNSETALCKHNPKCSELPLCSRKYIVLTAKEEIGTQVRPKLKMACRHDPHCFMIPKCLVQAINGDILPYAIPGCVHSPQCEKIPACCRKSYKNMVSVPSQYPNACRIV